MICMALTCVAEEAATEAAVKAAVEAANYIMEKLQNEKYDVYSTSLAVQVCH